MEVSLILFFSLVSIYFSCFDTYIFPEGHWNCLLVSSTDPLIGLKLVLPVLKIQSRFHFRLASLTVSYSVKHFLSPHCSTFLYRSEEECATIAICFVGGILALAWSYDHTCIMPLVYWKCTFENSFLSGIDLTVVDKKSPLIKVEIYWWLEKWAENAQIYVEGSFWPHFSQVDKNSPIASFHGEQSAHQVSSSSPGEKCRTLTQIQVGALSQVHVSWDQEMSSPISSKAAIASEMQGNPFLIGSLPFLISFQPNPNTGTNFWPISTFFHSGCCSFSVQNFAHAKFS